MIALCVDDEYLLLEQLRRGLASCEEICEVAAFEDELDALEWASKNRVDIAFLDIMIHSMGGMELCQRLREMHPGLIVVFCTGHEQYALDAFQVHANGYLLKPLDFEELKAEVTRLAPYSLVREDPLLCVNVRGTFAVTSPSGEPLAFKRNKAKELLAILIDGLGETVAPWEIAERLWYGETVTWSKRNQAYLYNLVSDLKHALKDVDAEAVLEKLPEGYRVNMTMINVNQQSKNGETYMAGYSWAKGRNASHI